ncbi:MAG TPA: glutamine synthetase, partial [Plasticicumulans sp.]|nr:glutamine synthetase [Plasticicumulans sp.]
MNAQNAAGNAGTAAAGEAERFLAAHPDLEAVDLLLTDANGVARGKRLRPHELPPVYAHGRYLPGSILGLDLLGHDVHESGLVWDDGDADRLCVPVPGTLARAPWQPRPTAQALLTMHELDGRPAAGDPRHALVRSVAALEALGL